MVSSMLPPNHSAAFATWPLVRNKVCVGTCTQAQDYRIQYDSIVRLFVLPKSNSPQTLVVVSLDPPIRKGQTYYPHILLQFQNDEMRSLELDIPDDAFNAKNAKVVPQGFGKPYPFNCETVLRALQNAKVMH